LFAADMQQQRADIGRTDIAIRVSGAEDGAGIFWVDIDAPG